MTQTTPEFPPIMTVDDIAEYLLMHPLTVRRLANEGVLPMFKVGRQWRAKRAILDRWIEELSMRNLIKGTEQVSS